MATTVSAPPARVRWGDVDDEEDALPPPSTTGPDARGVKTAVEYRRVGGDTVKVTTKTRVSKVERKVYKVRVPQGGAGAGGAPPPAPAFFFCFLSARRRTTDRQGARPAHTPGRALGGDTLTRTLPCPAHTPTTAGRRGAAGLGPVWRRCGGSGDRLDHRAGERGHPVRARARGQADPGRAQAGGRHEVGAGRVGQVCHR